MKKLAEYLSVEDAAVLMRKTADEIGASEVAVVRNLGYVYSPVEVYPLAPKVTEPMDRIAAFAVDMDGTSTTTEPLALHSLEYMVRRFTNRMTREEWPGLDRTLDYPYVIGNSNFRHTEFLVNRYEAHLDVDALRSAFIEALLWTLACMDDRHRLKDIRIDAVNCGLESLLSDPEFNALVGSGDVTSENASVLAHTFEERYRNAFDVSHHSALVSAALDVYYLRYHSILRLVERGEGKRLSGELLGDSSRHLVEPMPGYGVFLALIKGFLGEHASKLAPVLLAHCPGDKAEAEKRLADLGRRFQKRPARIGLVTASIAYETHATIRAIFEVMREEAAEWPLPDIILSDLDAFFADYMSAYDGFVCATDASEARLKPHRDLYTIALYQMSIPRKDYCRCVGLEDTEPGIISLRASGVGCAVALPNHDTTQQSYQAAAHVVHGGLPELILKHNLLLKA